METPASLLFCEDPFAPGKPDTDYAAEYAAAAALGFETLLFDFDAVAAGDDLHALKRIPTAQTEQSLLYRGWMLTPDRYASLYNTLLQRNYRLINTPEQYRTCHYLPENLPFIKDHTPLTVFAPYSGPESIARLIERAQVFGNAPVILKDYVKSEKHDWETACFVPDASDHHRLATTIDRLLELRGPYLNEGLVIRAFEDLKPLAIHSKSGMPLTEEYRLFFFRNKLIGSYNYWEEGDYAIDRPDTTLFAAVAKTIPSAFFTMDIARKTDGSFTIIELGDGQVSGLPDKLNRGEFYRSLFSCLQAANL